MYFSGIVKKRISPQQIEVELVAETSCVNCGACGGRKCQIIVITDTEHKVGDKVIVELASSYFWKAFFLVYVLPLLFLLIGLLVNTWLGFLLFILAFGLASWYDRRIANRHLYKISK